MSKHAKWIAKTESTGAVVIFDRDRKMEIACVFDHPQASLIAAAPQMLEALRMFWRAERLNDEQYVEALRAADRAILAATRETK